MKFFGQDDEAIFQNRALNLPTEVGGRGLRFSGCRCLRPEDRRSDEKDAEKDFPAHFHE